jgi:hypothetical protein
VAQQTQLRSYEGKNYFLTPYSRVPLEKLTVPQLLQEIPQILWEIEGSIPHSKVPANCPHPEPDQSSPFTHIPFPEDTV